jgi:ankyrin repeat protein
VNQIDRPNLSYLQRGRTALLVACDKGNVEIARVLLEAGANIEAQDKVSYSRLSDR